VPSFFLVNVSRDDNRPDVAVLTENGDCLALRRALRHEDPSIRARAIDALATLLDMDSLGLLREVLSSDEDEHVREEAAVALGRLGDIDAVDDLIAALQRDPSEHVREEAAGALGRLGDERAVSPLLGATGDPYTMVRRAATEALDEIGAGLRSGDGRRLRREP
jgi:HEAT repeat protein